jgi:hypothetical protein
MVANGSGVTGLAGRLSTRLHSQGYDTVGTGNALQTATTSKVYFVTGFASEAAAVAQFLKLPPSAAQPMPNPPPVNNPGSANIVVVAGSDLASGSSGSSGGGGSTGGPHTSSTTRVTG